MTLLHYHDMVGKTQFRTRGPKGAIQRPGRLYILVFRSALYSVVAEKKSKIPQSMRGQVGHLVFFFRSPPPRKKNPTILNSDFKGRSFIKG